MSVQFGVWNFDGKPADPAYLRRVEMLLEPFAPDGIASVQRGDLALILGSFRTSSRADGLRPIPFGGSKWMLWDGRIDNPADLAPGTLSGGSRPDDSEMMAELYERRGMDSFAQIVGDWAASICCESEKTLILAKDYLGTRPLFYRIDKSEITWSTILEPLVLLSASRPRISESYLAGWITFFPEDYLSPYEGIYSVPPGSCVEIRPGKVITHRSASFASLKTIRYATDREYEEHFLHVFREAVRRRMDSAGPILAELSGGMDSSAIVCVADTLVASGHAQTSRIDTVTYTDAAEPSWDEMPLVSAVETKRGRPGRHIELRLSEADAVVALPSQFQAVPTTLNSTTAAAEEFASLVSQEKYRVVLSGLGGDEMLGGVPTPIPELADLLARCHGYEFVRQSFRWAVAKKKPVVTVWQNTMSQFSPRNITRTSNASRRFSWFNKEFAERNRPYIGFSQPRLKLFGRLPSLQANLWTLEILGRQFACTPLASRPAYEWRYPFMDRDLVAFCLAIPRSQLVRPHQRRSLMRRALAGLVPSEILERRRKACVTRGLVNSLKNEWNRSSGKQQLFVEELEIVDRAALKTSIHDAEQGRDVAIIPLLRTLTVERWLRGIAEDPQFGKLASIITASPAVSSARNQTHELLGRERPQQKGGDYHDLHQT
jgi:asparagine synthase (glutamine-hydrolysing)